MRINMNCWWVTIVVGACFGVCNGATSLSSLQFNKRHKQDADIRHVIVDTDIGLDDYLAILELFYAEKLGLLKIEAIVCTSGNTNVTHVINNAVRLLSIVEKTDIPLYKGVDDSIIYHTPFEFYFGQDGFGDMTYDDSPDLSIVKDDLAATAIRNLVKKNPKKYTLIALAPLTNVALTSRLYADYLPYLRDIWILGGSYEHNVRQKAEFNFLYDPEAAHMVFDFPTDAPIYLLPQETFRATTITYDWRLNVLGAHTPAMEFLFQAELSIKFFETNKYWGVADQLLVFCFVQPDSCTMPSVHNVEIELHDPANRAWITFDAKNTTKNVRLIDSVDQEKFKKFLIDVGNNV